jgi:medium-chain acyl-[acyl-carrier-protein] hydrolase
VSHLARPEFLAAMRGPYEMDPELLGREDLMDIVFPSLRADYEVVETYVLAGEPPLDLPLSAFGGASDPETTDAEMRAWKRHTTGPFRHRMLPGKHMFINTAREALLGELAADLAMAVALCRSRAAPANS